MNSIKISVIINSFKGTEKYLEECLESVSAQTIKPFETILVIDGYQKPMVYPGITTIIRDINMGVAFSRDEGVKIMRGTHILFIDADDVIPENYISEMIQMMKWKEVDIVYPPCVLWNKWGTEAPKKNEYFTPPVELTMKDLLKQNYVVISSLMKKEVYVQVGGFDPDLDLFEDWLFFLKAMKLGFKFYRANTFLKYRQRTLSRNHHNEEHKIRITEKIRNSILSEMLGMKDPPKIKSFLKKKKTPKK